MTFDLLTCVHSQGMLHHSHVILYGGSFHMVRKFASRYKNLSFEDGIVSMAFPVMATVK